MRFMFCTAAICGAILATATLAFAQDNGLDREKGAPTQTANRAAMAPAATAPSTHPAAGPATQASQPATMPDAEVQKRIKRHLATLKIEGKKGQVKFQPLASTNIHLGKPRPIANPFPAVAFRVVNLGEGVIRPDLKFAAVKVDGAVIYPFDPAKHFDELFKAHASSLKVAMKDEQLVAAAELLIHLQTTANQDGWVVLSKADDFLDITFNMPKTGPAVDKRKEASQLINAPEVSHSKAGSTVKLYAWHIIGGKLRKWTVEFSSTGAVTAKPEELGRFGGGGYD